MRSAVAQRNHIGLALRAFLSLERFSSVFGISWYEAKTAIIRRAVTAYLPPTALFVDLFTFNCVSPIESPIMHCATNTVLQA